jgi:hypothetical protein
MRVFLISVVAAVLIACGAAAVLQSLQKPAYEAFREPSVRLDDPGYNLVGRDWSGAYRVEQDDRAQATREP